MNIKDLVNKQFEIEGIDYDFERLMNDGYITLKENGKEKKIEWYRYYKFSSEENYEKWKEFCLKHITKKEFINLDFKYGMVYKYKSGDNS